MGVVTNGRQFSDLDYCKRVLDAGTKKISISLEGASAETHDQITHRTGSFSESLRGLQNLLSLGFPVDVITTVCRSNAGEIRDVIALLGSLGLEHGVLNLCTPSIDPSRDVGDVLPPMAFATTITDLLEHVPKGTALSVVTPFPICLLKAVSNTTPPFGICQMYHGEGLTIDVDGTVIPCTHFAGAGLFPLFDQQGDVIEDPDWFLTNWNTQGASFRERLWTYPASWCTDCDDWQSCLGGCPLFWTAYDPEQTIADAIGRARPNR